MDFPVCVAQLGARMHYAVPRILHESEMLERLFTDSTATVPWASVLRMVPERLQPLGLRRLLGRVPEGVPRGKLTTFERFGWEYVWHRWRARGDCDLSRLYISTGREFCRLVIKAGLGQAAGVYTFNGAGLELLEHARRRGLFCIVEQTSAPAQVEDSLLAEELNRNPGWQAPVGRGGARAELAAREQAEWKFADLILCGSDFVRRGIRERGGPIERCETVPYGVNAAVTAAEPKQRSGALRVLTCGTVSLMKGAAYTCEVARTMRGAVEFRWVGPVVLLPKAAANLRGEVDLWGAVPRTAIHDHYAWADAFLLPTICEGSATVCYEALASGLPVITTPNAGSVVRDGLEGFIVPIRDPQAISEKLDLLARDRELLAWMSKNARERALEFNLEKYGTRLIKALRVAFSARTGPAFLRLPPPAPGRADSV